MKKAFLLLAALAASSILNAAQINGSLTIAGGATLNGALNTATQVSTWVNTTVESRSGDFTSVAVGTPVAMTQPWVFSPSTPTPALWSVGGFTFNLASSTIVTQTTDFLTISGTGTLISAAFDNTPGVWRFSTQSPSANSIFSFSASTTAVPGVPDGGATVALLGMGLAMVGILRRKLA